MCDSIWMSDCSHTRSSPKRQTTSPASPCPIPPLWPPPTHPTTYTLHPLPPVTSRTAHGTEGTSISFFNDQTVPTDVGGEPVEEVAASKLVSLFLWILPTSWHQHAGAAMPASALWVCLWHRLRQVSDTELCWLALFTLGCIDQRCRLYRWPNAEWAPVLDPSQDWKHNVENVCVFMYTWVCVCIRNKGKKGKDVHVSGSSFSALIL